MGRAAVVNDKDEPSRFPLKSSKRRPTFRWLSSFPAEPGRMADCLPEVWCNRDLYASITIKSMQMTVQQPSMINSATNNGHMLMLNKASGLLPSSQHVLVGSTLLRVDACRNIDM